MTIPDQALSALPAEPPEMVAARIRDGDLLLCAAHDPFSRLIAWSTKSPWTHVAVALDWRGECVAVECVQHIGVRAAPLRRFLAETSSGVKPYPGRILLARHQGLTDPAGLTRYAIGKLGDRFSGVEIAKIALRICLGRLAVRMPPSLGPDDEFICSEFVARALGAGGAAIAWDGLGFIAPCDIAREPAVAALGRFRTGDPEKVPQPSSAFR